MEAVFKKPGMYIGSTDAKGKQHCFIEIADNSVDEHNAGYCNHIKVELFEDDSISVEDNGRGIPVDIHPVHNISAATLVVTELHAGGKFGGEDSSYHRSGGLHGVGASVVNALSDWFEMTIYRDGNVYFQRFELKFIDGKVAPAQAVDILKIIGECDKEKHGTKIHFKLNEEKFSSKIYNEDKDEYEVEFYKFNPVTIKEKLELLAFLNPSLKIEFINHNKDQTDSSEPIKKYETLEILEDGSEKRTWLSSSINDYLEVLSLDMEEPIIDPINFEIEVPPKKGSDKGNVFVRVALQWFAGEETKINGFVNNIYTAQGGTHITGFKKALTSTIKNYVNNNATDKDKKDFEGIDANDITEGLIAAVSIKIAEPQFVGQTKDKLSTREAESPVQTATSEFLVKLFDENPRYAKDVVARTLRAKKAREAASKARKASIVEKGAIGFSTPAKLADCQSKDPAMCELFLVEGDSAGGSAKQARDKKFQAILPLKGKILNVQKSEMHKVLANDEINALLAALGCGIGKNFDINKLRYHKIIYMTDADVDGQHIRTLLSTFFYRYLPDLIKNNHVYVAIAPLYRLKKQKGNANPVYLKDDAELNEFAKNNNMNLWDVSRFKGLGEMNPDQLKETTMSIETRELGLIEYIEDYEGEIEDTFDMLMGNDADKRKDFISNYK